jgi:hypothetical protein
MDRRWSARKRLQLHVTLELPRYTEPVVAELRDISLSGAYIQTHSALPHSLPLMVELHLPGSRVYEGFRLQAHVVRRDFYSRHPYSYSGHYSYPGLRPRGAGLMFLGTSTDTIRALSKALSQYGLTTAADVSNF